MKKLLINAEGLFLLENASLKPLYVFENVEEAAKILSSIRLNEKTNFPTEKIVSFLAVLVAGFSNPAMGIWKAYFFEPLLVFILVINLFQEKKDFQKIIFSLALSALAVSVFAIYQKITGH